MRRIATITALWMVVPVLAFAQFTAGPTAPPVIADPSNLTALYESLMGHWFATISPYSYELFVALATLSVAVFGWKLWRSYHGDIQTAMLETANKLLVIGFFLSLLMNAGEWMGDIINTFESVGKAASGMPGLGPSMILQQGFKIFGTLWFQALKSGLMTDIPTAMALIAAGIVICAAFVIICFQFVVTKVTIFITLGMGVIFLGFGGSEWTVPYVERYFALAVSSGVKLMVLYLLAGGGWVLTQGWVTAANAPMFSANAAEAAFIIACGCVLYAGICWHAPSFVASILGGSPNLSHSDFIAFAAPAIGGAVTAGLMAAGLVTGGTTAAAGAAGAVATSTAGGANPSGATPPQSSPAGGSSGAGMRAAAGLAQAGATAVSRMPHAGHNGNPPHFNGFHH